MKSKADVVSNIALVVAIISLLSAGAFLLIVIKTDEDTKLFNERTLSTGFSGVVLFNNIIIIRMESKEKKLYVCERCGRKVMIRSHGLCQACRSKELTPKKKNRITSIKNSSKKKKLENPDLSGFFRLMLEELSTIRMSMTGKAIHFSYSM